MASPVQLLPGAGRAPGQPPIIYGQVSRLQPLPVALTDPLFVTLPYDPDHAFRFDSWPALHGVTLPAAGADVVLSFDDQHNMRVVWWDGATSMPSSSSLTAGGDASGSLSGLRINTVLGGQVPVTSASALGGVLTGTLPNPGFGAGALAGLGIVGGSHGPITVAAATYFTVPHGLGVVPQTFGAWAYGWQGYLQNGAPDATNMAFAPSMALSANYIYWIAVA